MGGRGGSSTEAVRRWGGPKDDRVQGGLAEGKDSGATTKNPSHYLGGCRDKCGCTMKGRGVGGGGWKTDRDG